MPMRPQLKFALAAGGAVVVGGLGYWAYSALRGEDKPQDGSLLCPAAVGRDPAPSESVGRGDFVVIQLQSADRKFHESTWANVLGETGGVLVATIAGEQVAEGIRPLATDKHGFRLGDQITLDRACIWEVFRPEEFRGQILCGPQITELSDKLEDEDYFPVAGGLTVQRGDRARILVGSSVAHATDWHEPLWTRIATISPSGQVITAIVDQEPELSKRHHLSQGSVVRFNRDCVIGV